MNNSRPLFRNNSRLNEQTSGEGTPYIRLLHGNLIFPRFASCCTCTHDILRVPRCVRTSPAYYCELRTATSVSSPSPPLTATTDRVLNCSHVLRMMMTMTTIEMVLIPFTGKAFLRAVFLGGIRKQSRKGCLAYSGSIRSRKQCERGLRETHFLNVPFPYVPVPRQHPSCVRTPGRGECELLLLLHKFKNCYGVSAAVLRCGGSMCAAS